MTSNHNKMDKMKKGRFAIVPEKLLLMTYDPASKLTDTHISLYIFLYLESNWNLPYPESKRLLISKMLKKLPYGKRRFQKLLRDLIDEGFVERVYENEAKRSRYLKVRFLFNRTSAN